jgi:large subunit ribosomal protein L35
MPKMKTHKASTKRFRVSANGKIKRAQAGKRHLNSGKPASRKRNLRHTIVDNHAIARKYIEQMGKA